MKVTLKLFYLNEPIGNMRENLTVYSLVNVLIIDTNINLKF